MKKMCMMVLGALLMLYPLAGSAEGLPDILGAVQAGLSEGLEQGAAQAAEWMDRDLTLTIQAESGRIEEKETLVITVTAVNPRPAETPVAFALRLPERLMPDAGTAWEAVLPAAHVNEETGALEPSETQFERKLTLTPGGASEAAQIECEMSMGTRFYRAEFPVALCVPDVKAAAHAVGAEEGRLHPGDALTYVIEITNAGTASKEVPVELVLPEGAALAGEVPEGFVQEEGRLRGRVLAEAARQEEAGTASSLKTLHLPVKIAENMLEKDEDALRLLAGQLRVDGVRVPLPRMQVCGPKISARLLPETDALEAGETMNLDVVVVNAGLAAADVQLSCVLPDGLKLAEKENKTDREATPGQAAGKGPEGNAPLAGGETLTEEKTEIPAFKNENGTLVFNLHMDEARETEGGVEASTHVLHLRVRAENDEAHLEEKLLGTTLAWRTDAGKTELGEAAAVRVYRPAFMGLTANDWNAVFWSGVLLVVLVSLLSMAVTQERRREHFDCE